MPDTTTFYNDKNHEAMRLICKTCQPIKKVSNHTYCTDSGVPVNMQDLSGRPPLSVKQKQYRKNVTKDA